MAPEPARGHWSIRKIKKRHSKLARIVHWRLCEKYGLTRSEQWYRCTAEPAIETEKVKILCDVRTQTDHVIEHRRPDIVVVEKDNKTTLLIDIAVPGDTRVEQEQEKVDK